MLLGEIFQVALQAIRANKLRSFLTMLGIIIGVGAVITMVALGSGAQKAVQARLQALGPTLLSIYPGQSFRGGIAIMFDQRVSVTVDDANALARDARYVKGVTPELTRNLQIKFGGQNGNVNAVINCEDSLTQSGSVIVNPPSNEPVSSTPLFNSSTNTCFKP